MILPTNKPVDELSSHELYKAIELTADVLAQDEELPAKVKYFVAIVREQVKREKRSRVRIGEFFRQRAIRDQQRTARQQEYDAQRPGRDIIERIHADRWARRISLLFSDIEALAPWSEKDTRDAFLTEQARRLEIVLAANPKLNEKQVAILTKISKGESMVYSEGRTEFDGRILGGLERKGLIGRHSWGEGYLGSTILIIADPDTQKQ